MTELRKQHETELADKADNMDDDFRAIESILKRSQRDGSNSGGDLSGMAHVKGNKFQKSLNKMGAKQQNGNGNGKKRDNKQAGKFNGKKPTRGAK